MDHNTTANDGFEPIKQMCHAAYPSGLYHPILPIVAQISDLRDLLVTRVVTAKIATQIRA
jgi:hypothetical protein